MANDGWTGQDKAKHFPLSAALGVAATHAAAQQHGHHGKQAVMGVGVGIAIGAGKALYDDRATVVL